VTTALEGEAAGVALAALEGALLGIGLANGLGLATGFTRFESGAAMAGRTAPAFWKLWPIVPRSPG
jgi:hypothetical protein